MARDLRILSASIERPDERYIPTADHIGVHLALHIESRDLKSRPVHTVRLTEDEALNLAADLVKCALIIRRNG